MKGVGGRLEVVFFLIPKDTNWCLNKIGIEFILIAKSIQRFIVKNLSFLVLLVKSKMCRLS